ncbi:hypothetical protein BEI60_18330 [Eisenbergiella tayi]|nr:hypothetical protein BEI60_18330 [Eisenbergiella tayi]
MVYSSLGDAIFRQAFCPISGFRLFRVSDKCGFQTEPSDIPGGTEKKTTTNLCAADILRHG